MASDVGGQIASAFSSLTARLPRLDESIVQRSLVLDAEDTTRLLQYVQHQGIPLNTDANRYLEFWSPRYNLDPTNHVSQNISSVLQFVDEFKVAQRLKNLGLTKAPQP